MVGSNRRVSRGRSRNGCLTCRIRRVKCDENKPTCQKCHSTGRKCDYVVDSPKSDSQDLQIVQHIPGIAEPIRMWKIPQLDECIQEPEYRSLEFFQLHTTLCFGKNIGLHLLQAAYHEPIIQTIAVAIGSLHRSFVHNEKGLENREEQQFTVQHYNKAIRQLVAIDSQNSPEANDTFLIACVLFYCFECLQGHYRFAVQHGTSGLKIIKQQQQMLATSQNFPRYMPQETVTLLFAVLENQILEIEGEVSFAEELRPALFSSFHTPAFDPSHPPSNIEEMRTWFELLYNRFTRFESICEVLGEQFDGQTFEFVAHRQHLREEQIQIRNDLNAWILAFESWLESGWADYGEEPHSVVILKIWRLAISIMLRLEWPFSELLWDQWLDDFALLISLVSDFLGLPSSPDQKGSGSFSRDPSPLSVHVNTRSSLPTLRPRPSKALASTFSMSLGIVTPLYLCATRCRDSFIRHRAIDILLTCQRREGLWDSELAGRITRRIVGLEEDAAGIQPGAPYTCSEIGLAARLRSLHPQYGQGKEVKIRYSWSGDGKSLVEETFTW